jgi:sensor c-di-GMP phosphodiesterase-like protein
MLTKQCMKPSNLEKTQSIILILILHYSLRVKKEATTNILHAVNRNEFELYFQPKINLRTMEMAWR